VFRKGEEERSLPHEIELRVVSSISLTTEVSINSQQIMDLFASMFGFTLVALSLGVTYHWGIKPAREEKKRREQQALGEMRRRHWERSRKRPAQG
jgi:hypothetical protein